MPRIRATKVHLKGNGSLERHITSQHHAKITKLLLSTCCIFRKTHKWNKEWLIQLVIIPSREVKLCPLIGQADSIQHFTIISETCPDAFRNQFNRSNTILLQRHISFPRKKGKGFSWETGSIPHHTSTFPVFMKRIAFAIKTTCTGCTEDRTKWYTRKF